MGASISTLRFPKLFCGALLVAAEVELDPGGREAEDGRGLGAVGVGVDGEGLGGGVDDDLALEDGAEGVEEARPCHYPSRSASTPPITREFIRASHLAVRAAAAHLTPQHSIAGTLCLSS
jgi:hypothetical protein